MKLREKCFYGSSIPGGTLCASMGCRQRDRRTTGSVGVRRYCDMAHWTRGHPTHLTYWSVLRFPSLKLTSGCRKRWTTDVEKDWSPLGCLRMGCEMSERICWQMLEESDMKSHRNRRLCVADFRCEAAVVLQMPKSGIAVTAPVGHIVLSDVGGFERDASGFDPASVRSLLSMPVAHRTANPREHSVLLQRMPKAITLDPESWQNFNCHVA